MKQLTDIQKEWVAALRSREYKQGTGVLRGAEDEFCVLGVLCDLASRHGVGEWVRDCVLGTVWTFRGHTWSLPDSVRNFSGLRDCCCEFDWGDSLTKRNDNGATFAEIADLIEAKAEELFV